MDLGSTLCTARNPDCATCPIQKHCKAFKASKNSKSIQVTDYPTKVAKTPQRIEIVSCCIIYHENSFLIIQRPSSGLLASMWEFPSCILPTDTKLHTLKNRKKMQEEYLENIGFGKVSFQKTDKALFENVGKVTHEFSHIKQTLIVDCCKLPSKISQDVKNDCPNVRWVSEKEISDAAVSKGMKKCFQAFLTKSSSKQQSLSKFFA